MRRPPSTRGHGVSATKLTSISPTASLVWLVYLQLRTNLLLTVLSTSLATCTTIAGFFAMNVINGLENSHDAFMLITCGSFALGAAVFAAASTAAR